MRGQIRRRGRVMRPEEREREQRFFDRLLEKYAPPEANFEPGYPALDRIVLYALKPRP